MKIKVLIVEDEILVAEDVASDLENDGYVITDIAISSNEALKSIENNCPHIILMDINIKGDKDGIELAEQINQNIPIPIIYVTSNTSTEFVDRAILTGPHAFISKPYNYNDLSIAIELALNNHNEKAVENSNADIKLNSIFVKKGDYHRKVLLEDVLYIEANGSYCNVYAEGNSYTFSFNLNHFQKQVSSPILKRVHRSYIVNLKNVDGFDRTTLLIGDKIIPVSNSYKDLVFNLFNKL